MCAIYKNVLLPLSQNRTCISGVYTLSRYVLIQCLTVCILYSFDKFSGQCILIGPDFLVIPVKVRSSILQGCETDLLNILISKYCRGWVYDYFNAVKFWIKVNKIYVLNLDHVHSYDATIHWNITRWWLIDNHSQCYLNMNVLDLCLYLN